MNDGSLEPRDIGQPDSPIALRATASMELELPIIPSEAAEAPMADAQPLSLPAALSPPPGSGNHAASAEHAIGGMNRSSSIHLHSVQRSGVEVYVWGAGDCGQLGDGTTVDSPHPHRIEALTGKDIATLSAGEFHTALSTLDGEVFIWGDNAEGQLGLRGAEASSVPSRVEALDNFKVQLVACGSGHTLAADDDGTTLAFGQSDYGQLGIGPVDLARVDRPKALKALKGTNVIAAAAGSRHSMLLDSAGVLYACGDGSFGALGLSATESSDVPRPVLKVWPLGVSQVAAGDSHSAALTLHGALFTWGRGRSGQLGLGDFQNVSTPTLVKALAGMHVAQVSCGGDHTLAASASGDAYSWGQGKWGATGLAHLDDTCSPQRLANLVGERVVQVSAGGRHSLLLTAVSEVWAVGCNDNGQVGGELGEAVLVPRRVAGLPAGHPVLSVVAGGSHSIAICQSGASGGSATAGSAASRPLGAEGLILQASNRRLMHPPALCPVLEAAVARGKEQPALIQPVVHAVERNFSNPGYLMHLFSRVHSSTGEVVLSDPLAPGAALDVPRIGETYQALLKLYDPLVATALGASSIKLLDMMEKYLQQQHPQVVTKPQAPVTQQILDQPLHPDLAWVAPTLFILLQNPLASDPSTYGSQIILRLGRILSATLPPTQRIPVRRTLQSLLVRLPADAFGARCVRPVQRYLTHLVDSGRLGAGRLEAMMAGVLLDVLLQANNGAGGKVPYHEFYNKALSSKADLQAEYLAWVRHRESSPNALVSFCQMPYLLTPEAKSHILHGEAMIQKEQHMSAAAMQALFQGQNPSEAGFLRIAVRRTHVVEDALNALVVHADDLKKPLRVTFVSGGVPEPAQDEGGVRKEFFQLLSRDLLRPEFGMFVYDDATRTYWFNPASMESEVEYALVGALLGLAIYNAVLLDVHFPLVLYKKLLGGEPGFADLTQAFPDLGRGLQALLDYEPASEVEAVFCRSFEVEYDFWGEKRTHELKPGGSDIAVTGENRKEYVQLYTKWVLDESISAQFKSFARGFLRVCGGPALSMFTPTELELLACGLPHLDFEGLRAAARYEGGYTADHQAVKWFWEIVGGMSLEQKRQFLSFTTGSDRAPVGGLASLSICVQRAGPDTERLPTSHTCFNTLLLPEYASKGKMAERLLTAITNAQGFGLQ